MHLSTTTKYAINILILMSKNTNTQYTSKELSNQLAIPYKYLTKVMTKLGQTDLVVSTKGKYGGFKISKNYQKIKMIDIIIVFDDINNKKCVLVDKSCEFEEKCILHEKWQKPRCAVDDIFAQTTLVELVEENSFSSNIPT